MSFRAFPDQGLVGRGRGQNFRSGQERGRGRGGNYDAIRGGSNGDVDGRSSQSSADGNLPGQNDQGRASYPGAVPHHVQSAHSNSTVQGPACRGDGIGQALRPTAPIPASGRQQVREQGSILFT